MIALFPVPVGLLQETAPLWLPYLRQIAERSRTDINAMCDMLFNREAGAFLIWDDETKKVKAFIGVRYVERVNNERVGEIIWLAGEDRKAWVHLFADLEKYLREQEQCVSIKAIARPGWKPHLETNGFRLTHMIYEKELS